MKNLLVGVVVGAILTASVMRLGAQQQPAAGEPYPALDHFAYWSGSDLRGFVDKLALKAKDQGTPAAIERFGDVGSLKFFIERRGAGDFAPESHGSIDDLIYVLDGKAQLVFGGTIEGGRTSADGETRGGRIVGGKTLSLGTGDLFHVPAGVPHHMSVAAGQHYYVLVVKATSTKATRSLKAP